ncbi:DUF4191 domain-containing protein [Serinibacter salmoneus]|uniref:Uncharacterized protein DUF4191 n=1 Tax=Serinibacter salmoneus TaxID=556530 RepID=A0A2A9D0X0_9MICO|nr:DUF4191 domain-containing protein [Serinibacter salmoneus]PFG19490.1 uncharacterized protein DUF4191 [Serinibacter salmoneus]
MARNSGNETTAPKVKKRRWYHQVWDVFQMTRKADPSVPWIMLAILLVTVAVGWVAGMLINPGVTWYFLIVSFPIGILIATIFLSRRAERAAYSRIEGQPGAVSAALGTIRRGWNIEEEPIAIDARTQAMVFRAVGRPGVVLVAEGGNRGAQHRLLESERKRVNRIIPEVSVSLVQCGREEGQVPLPKLANAVRKQKSERRLTSAEITEVNKRLRALHTARMPVPKGVDPTRMRPDRKAMRGR